MADVRKVYRTRSQAVTIGLGLVIYIGLASDVVVTSGRHPVGDFLVGGAAILLLAAMLSRTAFAALIADAAGVRVRNPFRTVSLAWYQISGFELGRYKIVGCVCLIRLRDGQVIPAFAVQGITGQPRRRSSVEARATVAELNDRLAAEGGRAGSVDPQQA